MRPCKNQAFVVVSIYFRPSFPIGNKKTPEFPRLLNPQPSISSPSLAAS